MNICFVLKSFSDGGIGRAVSIIANSLHNASGYNVYGLIYSKNGEKALFDTDFPCEELYSTSISVKTAMIKRKFVSKVADYIGRNDIDIIIACGVMFFPVCVFAAKLKKIKCICWEHTNPLSSGVFAQRQIRDIGAMFSDTNVVLTKKALEIYNQKYKRKKNYQIYNAIDPEIINKECAYNWQSKKIVSVGRLSYPKNYQRLIDIAAEILPQYPEWSWDIYGDGPEKKELEDYIQEKGLLGKLNLMGQVENIYDIYEKYSFMVMTSRYEGFPMVLLEGAVHGLPLVAFDVLTGPSEIIETGKNGFLCNAEENDEMIESIKQLIENVEMRKEMSNSAREKVKIFSVNNIKKDWISLLDQMG